VKEINLSLHSHWHEVTVNTSLQKLCMILTIAGWRDSLLD